MQSILYSYKCISDKTRGKCIRAQIQKKPTCKRNRRDFQKKKDKFKIPFKMPIKKNYHELHEMNKKKNEERKTKQVSDF